MAPVDGVSQSKNTNRRRCMLFNESSENSFGDIEAAASLSAIPIKRKLLLPCRLSASHHSPT